MSDGDEPTKPRLMPLFLIKPGTMTRADIERAEALTGICIVECAEPQDARLMDPPVDAQIDLQARAALSLMRYVVGAGGSNTVAFNKADLMRWFVDSILAASLPKPVERVKPVKK